MRFKFPDVRARNQEIPLATTCLAALFTAAGYYLSARLGLAFSLQPGFK
ncbi:MAG: hypothetical protein WA081_19515 [Desulfosalsimonadaceae bacterium]